MSRKKKQVNQTNIPQHEIEKIARCILPDILVFYESEDGREEYNEWKKQQKKLHQTDEKWVESTRQ